MTGLVLDTNVVISANIRDDGLQSRVVSFAPSKHASLYVSGAILEEYERVLRYPRLQFSPHQVTAFLDLVRRSSILVHPTVEVTECQDDSDNRFLECAEAAGAQYLVTGNKRHFPNRWKATEVVSGREFVELIAGQKDNP